MCSTGARSARSGSAERPAASAAARAYAGAAEQRAEGDMAEFTTRPVIRGTFGVVAAGHYLAAAIGMHVLESGGNAIDAGVAAGFALNLVKPQSNGIGGEAPILIYRAADGPGPRVVAINGQGSAPARATIEWFRQADLDLI